MAGVGGSNLQLDALLKRARLGGTVDSKEYRKIFNRYASGYKAVSLMHVHPSDKYKGSNVASKLNELYDQGCPIATLTSIVDDFGF